MLIGFIGDIHGRVFHAIAAAATWQARTGKRFDQLIQVGDLGAFPNVERMDRATHRYLTADPSEADFSRLMQPENERAKALVCLREQFASPIYFIRGNHEDFAWLHQLPVDEESRTVGVDPFDLFHYVPDGTLLQVGGLRIAFLGGVEERTDEAAIDQDAYRSLMSLGPGKIDVLVTHQGPYGSSIGHRGDVFGSRLISELLEYTQPAFHIAGHAHCVSGPSVYGRTVYYGLDCIVASSLWHPEARGLQAGCLAVLETETNTLWPVTDKWLSEFATPFDFDVWFDSFKAGR
jgi:Icc-related predicted phosphoesterase